MRRTRRNILIGAGALALAGAAGVAVPFRRDMAAFRARAAPEVSRVVETRHGPTEVAEVGEGPPFLMLHGTGGGFDQGLIAAGPIIARGYRVIAPSRFGYLRTPLPEDACPRMEAEAFADMLDALGMERVAVAGGSAGAIPALAFAEMFPDRTAALFPVVPALMIPGRAEVAPWSPLAEWAVMRALRSDLLFWGAATLARDRLIGTLLATDPALVAAASPEEQVRVDAMVESILPVSDRAAGLLYDNVQTNRTQDIDYARIVAPTLTLSCEDDRFLTAENARFLAQAIPAAEAIVYPTGGHLWVGRNEALFAAIDALLMRIGWR
jgi:2-hydroxy-6-oxonona-2,4-dienedioate hydrolase